MNIVIAGSRGCVGDDIFDFLIAYVEIFESKSGSSVRMILDGGNSKSADMYGPRLATYFNCKHKKIKPDYSAAREAGIPEVAAPQIRNDQLAKEGDYLVAVWDGTSKGTKSMIDRFEMLGKNYVVLMTNGEEMIHGPVQSSLI